MLGHHLSILFRLFAARGLHTAITLLGLAIGLASCIMISLYVRHELSFEEQFSKTDRIYRISRDYRAVDGARARAPAQNNAPVAGALIEAFPEIEKTARVFGGRSLLEYEDTAFYEPRFRWADSSFFDLFDFEWVAGDPASGLATPDWIVLTEALAKKYFGNTDPIGKTVTLENRVPLRVVGVIRDPGDNTHLALDAVASLDVVIRRYGPGFVSQWNSSTDFHTYFLLKEGASVEPIRIGIPQFLERRAGEGASRLTGMTIMNIGDIHLDSRRDEEWKSPASRSAIYGFVAIAILILVIACVNFINLSTASASSRATEVGVRKSLGATRTTLIAQFLAESVATVAAATFLAMCIVELVAPSFGAFIDIELPLDYFGNSGIAFALLAVVVLVGLFAGSYPAFYLSAFEPARVLKGDTAGGAAGAALSRKLVTLQFAIAIALIVVSIFVYQQMRFVRNIDLGFDKDQIVVLAGAGRTGLGKQWGAMRERLLAQPGVESVTASHYTPFTFDDNRVRVRQQGAGAAASRIQYMAVDYDFFETYKIDVIAGRGFSRDFPADVTTMPGPTAPVSSAAFVLNEAAARLLGWTAEQAVSQTAEVSFDDSFSARVQGSVIGVVRNTYFESVEKALQPMVLLLYPPELGGPSPLNFGAVRISTENVPATLARIDATWRELMPDYPVNRHFLSEDFDALYRSADKFGVLLALFSVLAVLIASVGLFGLASLTTQQRTMEIGVRKVLGGSVSDIVQLFCKEFGILVLLANVFAWPVAYLLVRGFLDFFAYRIDVSALVFLASAIATLALALMTVGLVAARAASADPIHSLRHE